MWVILQSCLLFQDKFFLSEITEVRSLDFYENFGFVKPWSLIGGGVYEIGYSVVLSRLENYSFSEFREIENYPKLL